MILLTQSISRMYLAHETAFIIGGIIIIIVIHQCNEAADWVCMQAEEDEQRLSEAQQAAEDEAALRAMREEGMLSDQPNSSQPQPGKPGHAIHPPPPPSLPALLPQSAMGGTYREAQAPPQVFCTHNCLTWAVLSFVLSCLILSCPLPLQVKQIKQSAGISNPHQQTDQTKRRS